MLAVAAVVLGITLAAQVVLAAAVLVLVEANLTHPQVLPIQAAAVAVVDLLATMVLGMVVLGVLALLLFDTLSLKGK